MTTRLVIPPCGETPKHPYHHHLLPEGTALRVSICALKPDVRRLLPDLFPPPGVVEDVVDEYEEIPAVEFAKLAFAEIFGRPPSEETPGDFVLQQVSFGGDSRLSDPGKTGGITDYGIIFDHLVPDGEDDPEVLQLNTFSVADFKYAKIPLDKYAAKGNVILLPRCCQVRFGSTDRGRTNDMVRTSRHERQAYAEGDAEEM